MLLTLKTDRFRVQLSGDTSPVQQEMEDTLSFLEPLGLVVTRGGRCQCIRMGIFHGLEWGCLTRVVCTVPRLQVGARCASRAWWLGTQVGHTDVIMDTVKEVSPLVITQGW